MPRNHHHPDQDSSYGFHDHVAELTRPYTHREPYSVRQGATTWNGRHITEAPSLIDQLLHTAPSSGEAAGSSGYTSRPAARLEALDAMTYIDLEAARWVRDLGEDDPGNTLDPRTGKFRPGSGTTACIRLLHGLWASADQCTQTKPTRDCCTRHEIERDVRRWWTQARILSGWDSAPWRPNRATCPLCGERGTLRVRLAEKSAICTNCRETWDPATISFLADHIRAENEPDTPDTLESLPTDHERPKVSSDG